MSKTHGGNCRLFCICSYSAVKEIPQRMEDFIFSKAGKPTLPKDIVKFLEPEATYRLSTEVLVGEAEVRVRYSKEKVDEKIAEVKKRKLPNKTKKMVLTIEKGLPFSMRKIKKPHENRMWFRLQVKPRFELENSIRAETLEELVKGKDMEAVFGLMEDIWSKPFHMTTCVDYEYEAEKFKPVGGLLLPTRILLPSGLGAKFGKSELDGISLKFEESPMGLENIDMSLENDKTLVVGIRTSYEIVSLADLMKKAYELTHKMSNLLVEEVK